MMSEVLDDERKEAFLQALHGLKDEQQQAAAREREIQRSQQEQLEAQRRDEERQRREEKLRADEEVRLREDAKRHRQSESQAREAFNRQRSTLGRPEGPSGTAARPRQSPKENISRRPSDDASVPARVTAILSHLQSLILASAQHLRTNPLLLLRTILFILAFALAFGRREMRARIKRTIDKAWMNVKRTVGMGVKVSYI
jgi:hypothetical protein